jgi:hypothetical protein
MPTFTADLRRTEGGCCDCTIAYFNTMYFFRLAARQIFIVKPSRVREANRALLGRRMSYVLSDVLIGMWLLEKPGTIAGDHLVGPKSISTLDWRNIIIVEDIRCSEVSYKITSATALLIRVSLTSVHVTVMVSTQRGSTVSTKS